MTTKMIVSAPILVAYYLDKESKLVVVEIVSKSREINLAPNARNWRALLTFTPENAAGAHVDSASSIEIAGLATKALYVVCEGPDKMRLVATESLAGVQRKIKPPKKIGKVEACRCTLVRCGPGRLCCPC